MSEHNILAMLGYEGGPTLSVAKIGTDFIVTGQEEFVATLRDYSASDFVHNTQYLPMKHDRSARAFDLVYLR